MSITVQMTDSINVRISTQPKKKKKDPNLYDIYLLCTIAQHGITQCTPCISTGIEVERSEWKHGKMKGRNDRATLINSTLNDHINTAKFKFSSFKPSTVLTCSQVKKEVLSTVKTAITGKVARGKKKELTNQVKLYTVDAVMADLFRFKQQSQDRQRIYKHAIGILHQYYNNETPLITEITELDLINFKAWYSREYRLACGKRKGEVPANDSTVTWFTMIASVFVHAHKKMKILSSSPLPSEFRGTFSDIEKDVLREWECMRLIDLKDEVLSPQKRIAKYCLLLQLTTGMGLGDIRMLTRDHVKFDRDYQKWYLHKLREKNGKPFKWFLTSRAKYCYDQLRELSGGADTLFKLTSTNNINKHYKDLALKAGVETHVTSYILRHSFAVDFMDRDGILDDLSVILGNDIRNTKKYGRISKKRLDEKNRMLELNSPMHQL